MGIQRRLGQLESECKKKGIAVTVTKSGFSIKIPSQGFDREYPVKLRGNKLTKNQYILGLREWSLKKKFPDGNLPKHLKYIISMDSPMLCLQFNKMDEKWQQSVWKDDNWLAEVKVNGVRIIIVYSKEEGIHFYSRNISLKDYLPIEYKNIWIPNFDPAKLEAVGITECVLDTEVLCPVARVNTTIEKLSKSVGVITDSNLSATAALLAQNDRDSLMIQQDQNLQLDFFGFHVLSLNQNDIRKLPWHQMTQVMHVVRDRFVHAGFPVRDIGRAFGEEKRKFHENILNCGGEGTVLKRKDSTYIPSESRLHRMWVKCKRMASETLNGTGEGLGDSIDGFISGFKPGNKGTANEKLVGALIVSVYLNKEDGTQEQHEIAHVSGITSDLRESLTSLNKAGEPVLNKKYYNQVVTVDGNWISTRSKRLMHPRFVCFRPDRSPETCVMDETTLNRMIIK